ncbi:MAG: putative bifunctional diguanylate cyclase/phosphodiesterase [Actinomycetota bacterium]
MIEGRNGTQDGAHVGRRGRTGARSARLFFLIPVVIAVTAAYAIDVFRSNADEQRQAQVLLAQIQADANQQAELTSEVSQLGVVVQEEHNVALDAKLRTLPRQVEVIQQRIVTSVSLLNGLSPEHEVVSQVQTAVDDYQDQVDRLVQMLEHRDFSGSWIFDRRRIAPAFAMLRDAVDDAHVRYSQRAEAAGRMADIGTIAIVGLAVLALAFLHVERSRRSRVLVAAEQRIIMDSEARFRSLVQNSSDAFIISEVDLTARYVSPSIQRFLGYTPMEIENRRIIDLVHPDDAADVQELHQSVLAGPASSKVIECRLVHKEGSIRDVQLTVSNSRDVPSVSGLVFNARDITERKDAERERVGLERQLEHQAFHDPLTNLANRVLFKDRVNHALARASRTNEDLAVLFVDLDDFKQINDTSGHEAGDFLLIAVGDRLRSCLRDADTIARLGGDEFAILLEAVDGHDDVFSVADRLLESLIMPFDVNGRHVLASGSIGIAFRGSGGKDSEELLANADVAMYAAKARGKGCRETYRPDMRLDMMNRLNLESALQRAIDEREFLVYYQPIVEVGSGRITGAEALVRWAHPSRGIVSPADFIPLAEETGLIVPIGRWVLEQSCYQARAWQLKYPQTPPFKISVNLSVRQFQQTNLVQEVAEVLQHSKLPASSLILEITESILVQDTSAAVRKLQALKNLGVQLALDDFGTGYSSLSYLRRFPIDVLKIDKTFIDGVGTHAEDSALTRAIVQIGETLNLKTVAEGVEHEQQRLELESLGCEEGQGYFFARPIDADSIGDLLDQKALADA